MSKRTAAKLATTRYAILAAATASSGWLSSLGREGWDNLSTYEVTGWFLSVVIAVVTAVNSTMNKRWSEAEREIPPHAEPPKETEATPTPRGDS